MLKGWKTITDQVSAADPLARRYFLDTMPLRTTTTHLVVGYDPEFSEELERFDNPRTQLTLARVVKKQLGRILEILFEPLPSGVQTELPSDHIVVPKTPDRRSNDPEEEKWYANPVVKTVIEAFNGQITDIRE